MKVCEWPVKERPREKLKEKGPESLTDSELLAILLLSGTQFVSAVDLARNILTKHSNLKELSTKTLHELSQVKGIGAWKATTLQAAFELSRRIACTPLEEKMKVTDPEVVFQRYAPQMAHLKQEVFKILILNSANCLIKDVTISQGILNSSLVHPREVFRAAILEAGASIILIHNHPSQNVLPSVEDKQITRRLVEVGKLMDIPVLDHIIIIGNEKYFSFREGGLIE